MATQDLEFKLQPSWGAAYAPFTLSPGEVSSFQLQFNLAGLEGGSFVGDASAVVLGASIAGDPQLVISDYALSFPVTAWNDGSAGATANPYFDVVATGALTYVGGVHTNSVTLSVFSPWVSGDELDGASANFENIDFTVSPMICTFNFTFSTANISPDPLSGFSAVTSGSDSGIRLTWTNPVLAGVSATRIHYMSAAAATTLDPYVEIANPGTSYIFSALDNVGGIEWDFLGMAVDMDETRSSTRAASAMTVNASPSAITNFTATSVTSNTVALTWTNPTGSEGVTLSAIQINYTLGRNPSALNDGTITTLTSATTSLSVAGLTDGVTYGFAARAKDDDGQFSSPVYASVSPIWQGQPGGRAWSSHAEHMRMRNLGYI
jgi:hypothetical protein